MKSSKKKTYIISETNKNSDNNSNKITTRLDEKRCLTVKEFQAYCSIGRNNAFELIKESQSGLRIGKKILVDRVVFDRWLEDKMNGLGADDPINILE